MAGALYGPSRAISGATHAAHAAHLPGWHTGMTHVEIVARRAVVRSVGPGGGAIQQQHVSGDAGGHRVHPDRHVTSLNLKLSRTAQARPCLA
jgi:hypothetical protein